MSGRREWSQTPSEPAAHDRDDRVYDHELEDHEPDRGPEAEYHDDGWEEGWPVVGEAPAVDEGGPGPAPRRRRSGGRRILIAFGLLIILILAVLGGGYLWAQGKINPGGHRGPAASVVIPTGSSTAQIAQRLASAGVVHDAWLFTVYVHVGGYGPLLPGTYSLPKNSTYSATIDALRAGPKIVTASLVIPEGFTVADIARAVGALPNMGLSAQKFLAAAESGAVRSPYEPAGVNNLEGLLFPATYKVRQGQSEVDVLEQMIGAFDENAQSLGLPAEATKLGLSPYQVVTVASIVEREAKLAGDRPYVASAVYNRLRVGMSLGADSTQTYFLRLTNPTIQPTPAQLDHPSPYNTRVLKGLPPTPIANPGLASLSAAASPPSTGYLYFVEINPDGKLGFATNNAGFDSLQRQCRAAHLC